MANINADSKTGIIPVRPGMLAGSSPGGKPAEGQATNNDTNTKEKTPMCLVNELARYNKLKHQYTLIDEQGPAHKKTFYVQLVLGEEEYNSVEGSIKRAQHLAAQTALQTTKYKQPPPKEEKELGPYEPNSDKIVRLKPVAPPNPPGSKKAKVTTASVGPASQQGLRSEQASQPVGKKVLPRMGDALRNDGIVQLRPNAIKPNPPNKTQRPMLQQQKNMAQRSVERARNFMQNRNNGYGGGGGGSFGGFSSFSGSFGSGNLSMGPPLKRARIDLPPERPSVVAAAHDHEANAQRRERLEQEWEKIALERQRVRIEEELLKMSREKFDLEITLLKHKIHKYESGAETSASQGPRSILKTKPETPSSLSSASRLAAATDHHQYDGYGAYDLYGQAGYNQAVYQSGYGGY